MADNDDQAQQNTPAKAEDSAPDSRFGVQRVYVKDSSFEAPDSPEAFRKPYSPQINFSINSRSRKVDANVYEVVLRMTADVKQDDATVFLVEVQQAGVFEIIGIEEDKLEQVLNITCPNVLFPYGREALDSLVVKGSFPPLMLAPVNFEVVYMQAKQQAQTQAAGNNATPADPTGNEPH